MMVPVSEALRELLHRQGMANGRAGTRKLARMIARTAGTGAAAIGADDQGEEPGRPLTGLREGGERNPMGIRKTGSAKPPASAWEVGNEANDPSPAECRPVLRLVHSGRRRSAQYVVPPRLALVSSR